MSLSGQTCLVTFWALLLTAGTPLWAQQPPPMPAGQIWAEYGVATALAGIDPNTNLEIRHKVYLVVYGPLDDAVGVKAGEIAECARRASRSVGGAFTVETRGLLAPPGQPGADAAKEYAAQLSRQIKALEALAMNLPKTLRHEFKTMCPSVTEEIRDSFFPGLSLRSCVHEDSPAGCLNPASAIAGTDTASRFAMLIDWLSSLRDDQASIGVNDVVLFGIMDPARPSRQSRTQGGRLLTSLLVETDAPIPWVDGGTLEERQRAFELAVQRVREKGHRLPGMVARTLALSQEVVLQTADAVDDVAATVAELPTKPGTVLALVSDEIARARLLECSTFTGKNTAAELGICAGYTLSESEAMQCLVGKSCQPRLDLKSRSTAYAAALTIAGRYGIKELATSNLLPRNMVEGVSLENLQIEAGKCLDSARVNDDDTMNCLTRFFGKGDAGRYAKCLDTGRTSKEPITQVLRCIHGEVPQGALGLASCLENTRNKKGASADCLLQSIAPPALAQAMECSKQHHEPKAIARCALGDRDPKVAQLAECIDDARDGTWTHCASSLLGDAIPAEVAEFTKCVTPGSEYADVALCAAGDRLPKHARKGAQCLAQNGGDLIGSGICMAADSLNPYQQVALQCAATSSGEPTAFATCAGGRLLVMRVQGCLKDDFGSGACFGPNNDFQKAIKGIFGKEIKPNSPIGTVIGAHVEVIRTTVALAGDLADELEKLDDRFEKLGEKAKEFGRAFERGLAKAGRDFDRERRKVTRKVVGRDFDDWRRNPKKKARQLVKGVF